MTEAQLLQVVMDLAKLRGWHRAHAYPSLTSRGRWRTATSGDVGSPDLLLARGGVVLHPELKTQTGKYGQGQADWADAIGATHRLWRPSDLPAIQEELR